MMSKLAKLILVITLLVVSASFVLADQAAAADEINRISPADLNKLLERDADIVLGDVRSEVEYVNSHIPGAKLLPLSKIDKAGEIADKNDRVILYCGATECEASTIAAEDMTDHGFTDVQVLDGGFPAWEEAGYETATGPEGEEVREGVTSNALALGAVLGIGLVDGINPCAIGMLVFLLGYLIIFAKKPEKILITGTVYTVAVFITYFIIGVVFYKLLLTFSQTAQFAFISDLIHVVLGAILIVAGAINVKDFFWKGKGFSLEISKKVKPFLQSWVAKTTLISTVVLAILVTIFEMPCSLPLYAGTLDILARSSLSEFSTIGYIAIYNLMFVVPLVVILLIVYSGKKMVAIKEWEHQGKWWMKLSMGVILIGFGIWMLLT